MTAFALSTNLFVGVDLGTSGARLSVVQGALEVYSAAIAWTRYDEPAVWTETVEALWAQARENERVDPSRVAAICISGTSASCLMVENGRVTRQPRMYNYHVSQSAASGVRAMNVIERFAPDKHTAKSPTGTLAKLLAWRDEKQLARNERLCHQADFVAMHIMADPKQCGSGRSIEPAGSDWNNCLKLGYDVQNLEWPSWLLDCLDSVGLSSDVLPCKVVSPGEPLGSVSEAVAQKWGISPSTVVVGGTTDSNAAFIAAAGLNGIPGVAVTSLGSTLALKQLSELYVEDADLGVYSHRFPRTLQKSSDNGNKTLWLVGGASNVGCAILRQNGFSNDELDLLSESIDPRMNSPLQYYPLTQPGERFPVADSKKQPVLTPKPDNRKEYLHGILQGISDVECQGYKSLARLGASPAIPRVVWTCGGGSRNQMWTTMRERRLQEAFGDDSITVKRADNVEASYGAALLAASSFLKDQ
jgi:D-ribulokinase